MAFVVPLVAAVGTAAAGAAAAAGTVGTVGTVLSVASAGLSAVSAISQGNATAARARYAAQVAENNTQLAKQNAKRANAAGVAKAEEVGMKEAAIAGAVKTAQAANGVDVNTGSSVDVQSGQRESGKLDVENTLYNANLQAYGYRSQATNFEAKTALDRAEASSAESGGYLNATAGLISKATQFGPLWKVGSGSSGAPLDLNSGYAGGSSSTPAVNTSGYERY